MSFSSNHSNSDKATSGLSSTGQLHRAMARMKLRKYLKAEEWKAIAKIVEERRKRFQSSKVTFYGIEIPPGKVERETSRHSFETTMERLSRGKLILMITRKQESL